MLAGKHKLMREGAEGQAVVLGEQRRGAGTRDWRQYLDARVQYPDGSLVEFSGHVLTSDIGRNFFEVGDVVPVRYDPTDPRRIVFDVPKLKAQKAARDAGHEQSEPTGTAGQGLTAGAVAAALEQMANLGDLRNRGALTDSEYEAEKAKLQDLMERRNRAAITEAEFQAENATRLAGLPSSRTT
jgi:hypothetical protein